ncbi:hypothetical protein C8Q79DRAFT_1007320 [Trametes meyenii]|nr:hypothetical protein C8Q79DRAFT_1007320 [Trametes meyenii]
MPTESLAPQHATSRYRWYADRHFAEICIALFMCYFAWRAYDFALGIENSLASERIRAEQYDFPPEIEFYRASGGGMIVCATPPEGLYLRPMRSTTDVGTFNVCSELDENIKTLRKKKFGCFKFANVESAVIFATCAMRDQAFKESLIRHALRSRAIDEM